MKQSVCFLLCCASFCLGTTNNSSENTNAIQRSSYSDGSGQLLLLRQLTYINQKLLELLEHQQQMETQQTSLEKTITDTLLVVGRNMSVLLEQSLLILEQQKACINRDQIGEKISPLLVKQDQTTTTTPETTTPTPPTITSCKAAPSKVSGVYLIRVNEATPPFKVFCEQETFEGGWLVVQHRFDGSVDFYRNWTEYRQGFGDVDKELWLGLEKIHQITTTRPHEILVEIRDFTGDYGYARYNAFKVDNETDQYRLTIGEYSGNAGDSMSWNNGMMFSTMDRDNDKLSEEHCARERGGAWWHRSCTDSNLNGPYGNVSSLKSLHWLYFKNVYRGLAFSRMMIREL